MTVKFARTIEILAIEKICKLASKKKQWEEKEQGHTDEKTT